MERGIRVKVLSKDWAVDSIYATSFGVLSMLLGYIQFLIPGIVGAQSDFREIPLLISVFFIKNPVFFLLSSVITSISAPEGTFPSTVLMHFSGLLVIWFAYRKLNQKKPSGVVKWVIWIVITYGYYYLLVVPVMIITYPVFGISLEGNFLQNYFSILQSLQFEMLTSALVSTLFLVQKEVRDELKLQNKNLEGIVEKRTSELKELNEELLENNRALSASNQHIKLMNENLDLLAKERSEKIQAQLVQLIKYSHMNSHEVRAPLARILGLVHLLQIDKDKRHQEDLHQRIKHASEELDIVIRKMNRVLQEDTILKGS